MSVDYEELERTSAPSRRIADHTATWNKLPRATAANGLAGERLKAFCEHKHIGFDALDALGARIHTSKAGRIELAYGGENGNGAIVAIKYRPIDGSSHDSYAATPSTWLRPIVIGKRDSLDWIVAEGETDAARLWGLVGENTAIMALPAGARAFKPQWAALIPRGATVALAHDADPDGDKGAEHAARMLGGKTHRLRPPIEGGDWCDWEGNRDDFLTLLRTFQAKTAPFAGLTHAEVLQLEFPPERMLVNDLIPIGAVGTIAGVPETYKSWQAQTIAISVAHGKGQILGHPISHQGAVGYFWQDDSTREEAERIKLYHHVKNTPEELPLRWFLNEGLRLPEHFVRLAETIEHHGFVLVVLDSFYNILFGKDLKDEQAEQVIAQLKADICDQTGATILIVDHMPWATADNRQRLRSYGGVFKSAATRFGIYIDAVNNKLYVEARGNNISGFKRQPAEWNAETLELELVTSSEVVTGEEYEQRLIDYLTENPDSPTKHLAGKEKKVTGAHNDLVAARGRLLEQNRLVRRRERTSGGSYLWNVNVQAENTGTTPDSYQYVLDDTYAGTTSTPLRGDVPVVLPDDTNPPPEVPPETTPIDVFDPDVQHLLDDDPDF